MTARYRAGLAAKLFVAARNRCYGNPMFLKARCFVWAFTRSND